MQKFLEEAMVSNLAILTPSAPASVAYMMMPLTFSNLVSQSDGNTNVMRNSMILVHTG